MRSKRSAPGFPVELSAGAAAALACLLWIDPGGLFFPFLFAAVLHECGHITCLYLLGAEPQRLSVGLSGAELCIGRLPPSREALCAAAGPAVNLLCAPVFFGLFPRFAAMSLLLALSNLLPVFPLDGGRILCAFFPRVGEAVSVCTQMLLFGFGIYLTLKLRFGLWPLLVSALLIVKSVTVRTNEEKMDCKSAASVLQ